MIFARLRISPAQGSSDFAWTVAINEALRPARELASAKLGGVTGGLTGGPGGLRTAGAPARLAA